MAIVAALFKFMQRPPYYPQKRNRGVGRVAQQWGSLSKNLDWLREQFGGSVDFYVKEAQLCGARCAVCLCDDLAGIEIAWNMLLRPLQYEKECFEDGEALLQYLSTASGVAFSPTPVKTLEDVFAHLSAGNGVFLADGAGQAFSFAAQSFAQRSPGEPDSEVNVYGSKEAFCDVLRRNMGLIRRRVRSEGLVIETLKAGRYTQTEIALIYHRDLVDRRLLRGVKKRLEKVRLQMVFDSGYLAPFLENNPYSLFSCVGMTERPDTLCAKVCEGKVAVMADGTPYAVLVPFFFTENFQCMDDYSSRPYYASFIRIMKYIAFFTAVLLPGIFVGVANFTPELLPGQLLYKVAASEAATPLPLFLEAIFVNILLEIVKEAGLRLPKAIGHSVSLVAALIVGDAAIKFGILGSPVVIMAAISAICGFVVPSLYQPITILRMLFILAGGLLGPLGIVLLLMLTFFNICSINSFGMPYTAPLTPYGAESLRDGVLRMSWQKMQGHVFTVEDLPGVKGGRRRGKK